MDSHKLVLEAPRPAPLEVAQLLAMALLRLRARSLAHPPSPARDLVLGGSPKQSDECKPVY